MKTNRHDSLLTIPVLWTIEDGIRPDRTNTGGIFNLRSPTPLSIPAGASVPIRLGIGCNYPLQIFQARGALQKGLRLFGSSHGYESFAVEGDTQIQLVLKNVTDETQLLETGDVLARASVLDSSDIPVASNTRSLKEE